MSAVAAKVSPYKHMSALNDFFKLLGLPNNFRVDQLRLEENFKTLQKQFHPDKFARATPSEQRVAMQYATQINEAYQTLKEPVKRAQYMLRQKGFHVEAHTLKSDPDFLFQQMAWREKLTAATSMKQMQVLLEKTELSNENFQNMFVAAFEAEKFEQAQKTVDKLHFVVKFDAELRQRIAKMEA